MVGTVTIPRLRVIVMGKSVALAHLCYSRNMPNRSSDVFRTAWEWIRVSRHLTVFTGAGISVESGIPPFRGENGLWNRVDPRMFEIGYFRAHPEEAWGVIASEFYGNFSGAKPNSAHRVLAELESKGVVKTIITQNVDHLHQDAGSMNVLEFHGSFRKLVCLECGARETFSREVLSRVPHGCRSCGGLLKPDFVFFGEMIPEPTKTLSFAEAHLADLFLVIGSTGEVQPAALIPRMAKMNGARIIEINLEESHFTDSITDCFIQGKASEVARRLSDYLC